MTGGALEILRALKNFATDDEMKQMIQEQGLDAVVELLRAITTINSNNQGTRQIRP